MSEEDIERIMRQPWTMTSSDGGLVPPGAGRPHPRNNGAFARKLARYVRDRRTVTLEFGVRSMTSLPAEVFTIKDRGAIREGRGRTSQCSIRPWFRIRRHTQTPINWLWCGLRAG